MRSHVARAKAAQVRRVFGIRRVAGEDRPWSDIAAWPDADPTDDLEAAWLPVLYDLVAYLDWGAGRFPSDRDLPDPSGLRFATVRIDTAFPTIAHRAGTSRRDIPGHCSGFTVACARAQMESAPREVRRVAHAWPDGARYIAPPSEGMCSRPGTVI